MPYLLTPFSEQTTEAERAFNHAHMKARGYIEMTFGHLKSRFQCFKYLRVTTDRACTIIIACADLYNIATICRERLFRILPEEQWKDLDLESIRNPYM